MVRPRRKPKQYRGDRGRVEFDTRTQMQPKFTKLQGQYLAFIHAYTKLNRVPPAEADMQRYFEVTPPSVHQMVLTLEKRGLIMRTPRQPRTIKVLVPSHELPELE